MEIVNRHSNLGAGCTGFKLIVPDMLYEEIMFEAIASAYENSGVNPRHDIRYFTACTEDCWKDFTISEKFVLDRLGIRMWIRVNCSAF